MSNKPKTNPSGSAEPMPGRCAAKLHASGPEDPRYGRYCLRTLGYGTSHKGSGRCKFHGGSSGTHIIKAERESVQAELVTLAEQMGTPVPVGDPYVELFKLTGVIKQWELVARKKMSELEDLTTTDRQGVERARALVEIWERAADRAATTYINLTKLGLMQHKAQLEEDHAKLLFHIVTSVIEDHRVGMTDTQLAVARPLLAKAIKDAGTKLNLSWLPDDMGQEDPNDEDIYDAVVVG